MRHELPGAFKFPKRQDGRLGIEDEIHGDMMFPGRDWPMSCRLLWPLPLQEPMGRISTPTAPTLSVARGSMGIKHYAGDVGALQQAQQSGRETVRSQCETVQHGDGESTNVPFPKPLPGVNLSDDKRPGASGRKNSGGGTRRGPIFFGKRTPFQSG